MYSKRNGYGIIYIEYIYVSAIIYSLSDNELGAEAQAENIQGPEAQAENVQGPEAQAENVQGAEAQAENVPANKPKRKCQLVIIIYYIFSKQCN